MGSCWFSLFEGGTRNRFTGCCWEGGGPGHLRAQGRKGFCMHRDCQYVGMNLLISGQPVGMTAEEEEEYAGFAWLPIITEQWHPIPAGVSERGACCPSMVWNRRCIYLLFVLPRIASSPVALQLVLASLCSHRNCRLVAADQLEDACQKRM